MKKPDMSLARWHGTGLRAVAAACAVLCWAGTAWGGATTDGTTGAVQSLSGAFTVPQSLGTQRGANLFHSFSRFSVGANESATFTTTDTGIAHVISRVTGGEATLIEGPVRLQAATGSAPSFWFVNPSGIVVGPGGVFDVPAGLHLGTTPQLRLSDGSTWDVNQPPPSSLIVATPESFGLLGSAAPMSWRDASLQMPVGGMLELAGGDITLQRSTLAVAGAPVVLQSTGTVVLGNGGAILATAAGPDGGPAVSIRAAALTLDGGTFGGTGIATLALPGSSGSTGGIEIQVDGSAKVLNGATVFTENAAEAQAAPLHLRAGSLTLDGGSYITYVGSYAGSTGTGGDVTVRVDGAAQVVDGGLLQASTFSPGASGALNLTAQTLTIDGRHHGAEVGTVAVNGLQGPSGPVNVQVQGALTVVDGGLIQTESATAGGSGGMSVTAGSLSLSGGTFALPSGITSSTYAGPAGRLDINVPATAAVRSGAGITTYVDGNGDASALSLNVGQLDVEGIGSDGRASSISTMSFSSGVAPALQITAGEGVRIGPAGVVTTNVGGPGPGSMLRIDAPRIAIDAGTYADFTGVSSSTSDVASGRGGEVILNAGAMTITGNALVSTSSISDIGSAGNLTVNVDHLTIDGRGAAAGLRSLGLGALAQPGAMQVNVRQDLVIRSGGGLQVTTAGQGRPGSLTVVAGTVLIDGRGSPQAATGIGGDSVTGDAAPPGASAPISVTAQRIEILEGGTISSSTDSANDAGAVRVVADSLRVDGGTARETATGISSDTFQGLGNAGSVSVQARQIELLNSAMISSVALSVDSETPGPARGGQVTVRAESLTMSGTADIFTVSNTQGGAGNIDVGVSGTLTIAGGAGIVANTGGPGPAGTVQVRASSLQISGVDAASGLRSRIGSRAVEGSGGQPGTVDITVSGDAELRDGAALTIANDAAVADPAQIRTTQLSLRAGSLTVTDAEITAASAVNASAGNITIDTTGSLALTRSVVRTSALDGDGGSIAIVAGGTLRLRDARITTSVEGRSNGNGGGIDLAAGALVMQSGFVQANTAAPLASGGQVRVSTPVLLPDGSRVAIGGSQIETFRPGIAGGNVIQAAAPDGVAGTLAVTLPQVDVAAGLVRLAIPRIDFGPFGRDLCEAGDDSSFTVLGRGALPSRAGSPLRIVP